jgi:hypothetical protein
MRAREFINEVGSHKRTFRGSPCTRDCSGHGAGYRWAQQKNIRNPNNCNPRSPKHSKSFVKGCRIKGTEVQNQQSRPAIPPTTEI